ncbi:patatin-like phospholipase family protein [Undibacterium sp. TJN25]|uniref:patatin-like phospholipase family protein n=1 Tax=Undibacterium sp. TJN25 TaxID=3413056 RepID=UPI003BEFDA77
MIQAQKYQRCMVMAGGGFRFGYYLGIHAAMRELGKTPDLLLASCGGAIAAAVIQALPDDSQRKAWLSSPDMYRFWLSLGPNRNAGIGRSLIGALNRKFFVSGAHRIPDLFHDYLFEVPAELPLPALRPQQTQQTQQDSGPDIAIIAGKLLYQENEAGQPRLDRKLFAETVFCPQRVAALLQGMQSPLSEGSEGDGGGNAIAADIIANTGMPVGAAVRASISDMFYFRCHTYQGADYIGGVIDLFPIEVASRLAEKVVMELKGPYDNAFSIPALRAVLGIHGNRRLRHVLQQPAELWVDTSDMQTALTEQQVQKKLSWRRNKVELVMPASHADYVQMIEAQWQFGYRRGMAAHARP